MRFTDFFVVNFSFLIFNDRHPVIKVVHYETLFFDNCGIASSAWYCFII